MQQNLKMINNIANESNFEFEQNSLESIKKLNSNKILQLKEQLTQIQSKKKRLYSHVFNQKKKRL